MYRLRNIEVIAYVNRNIIRQGPKGELIKELNIDTYVNNIKAISVFPIAIKNFPNVMTTVPIVSVIEYVDVCFRINKKAL